MERKYISKNGVVERTRYAVGDNAQPRRGKRRGNTSFRKQEQNFNSALRRVARILNCNFDHENGMLLTLDYDESGLEKIIAGMTEEDRKRIEEMRAPVGEIGTWKAVTAKARQGCHAMQDEEVHTRDCHVASLLAMTKEEVPARDCHVAALLAMTKEEVPARDCNGAECNARTDGEAWNRLREAAEKQMSLWLRRVKRKFGGKIKALMITSDVDHETGELVRVHHHIVFAAEGISWDLLRKEWKHGSVDIKQLRAQPDYTPIATYLMRQVRRQPDKKKYRVTQGMEMPKIEERVVLSNSEIRAPAGANVLERSEFSADSIGQYIRYVPKKREYRRKRTAEWKGDEDAIP